MPLRSTEVTSLPSFKDLPLDPSDPPNSAWGVWGANDQLGCLNHLTTECVLAASREIQSGISVGLSWELNQMRVPPAYRMKLDHEIFSIGEHINDDRVHFNTQTSSQWDGFRHWSYPDGRFYNGVTQEEVRNTNSIRNGIHEWTKKGIVGRGVLIDFYGYALEHKIDYDPWSFYPISVSIVKQVATENRIEFRKGDILFLRTGFLSLYENMSEEDLKQRMPDFHYPGLEGSHESLEWLWNTHFAAVAGDNPGFEAWCPTSGEPTDQQRMHETLLSGFGLPIGELFDLEALAQECKRQNRWSFFVTSQPLNVIGGVGSPPNALAIF